MLNSETIKAVLLAQIDINQYVILSSIAGNELYLIPELEINLKDVFSTLHFFGYISEKDGKYEITLKGINILKRIEDACKPKKEEKVVNSNEILYICLQNELQKICGKKQMKVNGAYPLLPNLVDFESRLSKICKKYNLNDAEKVKKCLISHLNKAKKQNWDKVQTILYYIEKGGSSSLATEYETIEDIKTEQTTDGSTNF